jgi:DNA-binding NarL/FixJ family response regulator
MMMLGADQLVIKPVGADDLLAALQSLYGDEPERFVAPSLLASAAA